MTSPRRSKEIWTIFKLSQCSALQSLTLAMTADILDPDLNDIDRLACTIIPHTPTTIQTITFELNRNYSFHPSIKDKINWEKMDDALNKVPNITRIAFKLPHTLGATFADWRACITEKLPQLHAKSLLWLSMLE
ncbi:hypothetical protein QCA50_010632 [Cerrena zonata]|uniref:Uncharacterized protein n=1 Tax=Cerrena zonata TaxID=2478898 RepID=A0AAW0FY17_9APHY